MHNEDLEGDIQRCWTAMRATCLKAGSNKVPVTEVMVALAEVLESTFGSVPEGYDDEAKVASFIAGLFLTHRGFASITQDHVPGGVICLEDSWPHVPTFEEVKLLVEGHQEDESDRIQAQDSGSVRHAQLRAEKAQKAEDIAARKAKKAAEAATLNVAETTVDTINAPEVEAPSLTNEEPQQINELNEAFEPHEWLVE